MVPETLKGGAHGWMEVLIGVVRQEHILVRMSGWGARLAWGGRGGESRAGKVGVGKAGHDRLGGCITKWCKGPAESASTRRWRSEFSRESQRSRGRSLAS